MFPVACIEVNNGLANALIIEVTIIMMANSPVYSGTVSNHKSNNADILTMIGNEIKNKR